MIGSSPADRSHHGRSQPPLRRDRGTRRCDRRDPDTALVLLGAFVVNHLMERLTARRIWNFLREKGFSPRTGSDPVLSERVRELTDRYVRGVQQARPEQLPLLRGPRSITWCKHSPRPTVRTRLP